MAFDFLARIRTKMNELFGERERKAEPLRIAPIPQEDVVSAQRGAFEAGGGISPGGGSEIPVPQPQQVQPIPQQVFPDVTQYNIPQPSEQIMNLLMQYFPQEELENAARVAFGESSYRPDVVHPQSGTTGLFQIHPIHQANLAQQGMNFEDMTDLEKNIQFAAWLQGQQGWNPWEAATKLGIK